MPTHQCLDAKDKERKGPKEKGREKEGRPRVISQWRSEEALLLADVGLRFKPSVPLSEICSGVLSDHEVA